MADLERTWKVGELARATGLTIRALHHYDEIGLLVPARTESGHRLYGPAEVERLYRVLALRGVGMALDDIAAALHDDGASLVDTVRRHVAAVERDIAQRRRLLDRLRDMLDALERSPAPPVDELIGAVEAMTVVEATIEDIVTREPWEGAWEMTAPHIVLLAEAGGDRVLPIWIGQPEAAVLATHRQGLKVPRPMGPDLMVALLGAIDARVDRIVVERLDGNTFFATVNVVTAAGDTREVDARPSDALNIAVRVGAPIQIARDVFDAASLKAPWPTAIEPPTVDGERPPPWISLSESPPSGRSTRYAVHADSPPMLRRAADEARELVHGVLMPAHLLLGILADEQDPAARLLARHGLELGAARDAVAAARSEAQGEATPGDPVGLGRRATFAMHRAHLEARRRGADAPDPMHLLLALVDSQDVRIAGLVDLDAAVLRAEVLAELDA